MKLRLNASEDHINIQKQAQYCIKLNERYMQTQKNQKYRNKMSLQYILPQSTRQKYILSLKQDFSQGQFHLLPDSTRKHVRFLQKVVNEGMKFTNTQYSSVRVRKHKKEFLSREKQPVDPEKYQQIRRYSQILSQRKKRQQQGGIDSFWMFKKEKRDEVKKVKVDADNRQDHIDQESPVDRTEAAFKRILAWGKQSTDGLIPKNLLKNYIASKLGQNFASWFLNFYQFRTYTTYKQFEQVCDRFKSIKIRQSHVVTFFLYDNNADSFICPKDIFGVFERQLNHKIEKDVLKIAQFVKKNIGRKQGSNEQFKIEHVVIRDDWLTVKDYEMYFKKVQQPYLKATNKKDTVFSKTFAVLDHREKVRSVRKEMNQKKTMYDQLYGEIAKERKNRAFIENDDYKLNYSFLYQIFKEEPSQLFRFCCDFIFNI